MKALIITFKDIKSLVKSLRFFFSLFLSSLAIIGLRVLSDLLHLPLVTLPPIFMGNLIFMLSLPCLALAILLSNSDILAHERSEGTILILFSQPVSDTSIILGKFLTMLSTGLISVFLNIILLYILLPHIISDIFIIAFLISALLFQLPIIGLTLLFSALFKRSTVITILVLLIYELLAILYSSQLILRLPQPFPHEFLLILQILIGSIFGYTLYSLGWIVPGVNVEESVVVKYVPININAQRLFYSLFSPRQEVQIFEIAMSILSLILITIVCLVLSFLVLKRLRSEYME